VTRISDEDLKALKETIEYWGNNCGGCETCSQVFGSRSQPDFDMQEIHMLAAELIERREKEKGLTLKEDQALNS